MPVGVAALSALRAGSAEAGGQAEPVRPIPHRLERDELGYDQTVMDLVFHTNAERVLGL